MLTLPDAIVPILQPFSTLFQSRTWTKAQVLLVGAILAPRKRTITSALRVMGLSDDSGFAKYHHVLNRAAFSPLQLGRMLLLLLIRHLGRGDEPMVFGMDETIERRRGSRISALGVYCDAVRSSESHLVKTTGLRWISLMWLANIPWAHRTWALPILTALAPSEQYHREAGLPHKKITDWARQMILQLRRWLPNRHIVVVADRSYAALGLLHFCQSLTHPVTFITRLRLDAALYEPPPLRLPGQIGRPRIKGQRLPSLIELLDRDDVNWDLVSVVWHDGTIRTLQLCSQTAHWYRWGRVPVPIRWVLIRDPLGQLSTQALLCTETGTDPVQIVQWFVLRWQMEVTFQEVRAHLGVETQRQWSDRAIARTTLLLLGLFSWVTLAAKLLQTERVDRPRSAAWYAKTEPTFIDAIALVRRHLWFATETFSTSGTDARLCTMDSQRTKGRISSTKSPQEVEHAYPARSDYIAAESI